MSQSVNTIRLLQQSLARTVRPGAFCIDATCGRGQDTLFLARLVGGGGRVLGFDVQAEALAATWARLKRHDMADRARLVLDGHQHMARYAAPETADCVLFNLGYLPGGDHRLATRPETTVAALEASLSLLKPLGVTALAVYHGGDTGFAERDAVLAWLRTLDHRRYTVLVTSFYNRPNHPPLAVQIVKEAQA